MLVEKNIQPKQYKRNGVTYTPTDTKNEYHAEIIPGVQIRIFGEYRNHANGPQKFDLCFKVGDEAEYGSYNLIYTGPILAIGKKTITIKATSDIRRLSLHDFCYRNWDFDLARITKHNSEEMHYI